jgi:hypothetical protein
MRNGSVKIPADVVRALGGSDTPLGLAILHDTFGGALHPMAGTTATVPVELVAQIGGGNAVAGRRVLSAFIRMVRRENKRGKGRAATV